MIINNYMMGQYLNKTKDNNIIIKMNSMMILSKSLVYVIINLIETQQFWLLKTLFRKRLNLYLGMFISLILQHLLLDLLLLLSHHNFWQTNLCFLVVFQFNQFNHWLMLNWRHFIISILYNLIPLLFLLLILALLALLKELMQIIRL